MNWRHSVSEVSPLLEIITICIFVIYYFLASWLTRWLYSFGIIATAVVYHKLYTTVLNNIQQFYNLLVPYIRLYIVLSLAVAGVSDVKQSIFVILSCSWTIQNVCLLKHWKIQDEHHHHIHVFIFITFINTNVSCMIQSKENRNSKYWQNSSAEIPC